MESKPEESNPTPESTEESTANKLNSMEDPEDLDMFVQTLMDSMVSVLLFAKHFIIIETEFLPVPLFFSLVYRTPASRD